VDVQAALADVAAVGPFFVLATGAAEGSGWRPLAEVHTDPAVLHDRIAHVRGVLGADRRVAASITLQGLAARVLAPPLAAAVVHAVLPSLDGVHFRVTDDGSWPLWCARPRAVAVPEPAQAVAGLAGVLDAHLVPLVAAVRAQVTISARLLWGNVASSVAAGRRLVAQQRPDVAGRAATVAQGLLDTPLLAGSGTRLPPEGGDLGWSFRRRTCCLFYRVPGGGICGDCVLLERPAAAPAALNPPRRSARPPR